MAVAKDRIKKSAHHFETIRPYAPLSQVPDYAIAIIAIAIVIVISSVSARKLK